MTRVAMWITGALLVACGEPDPKTCEPGTFGPECSACACDHGACDDGRDGTGACTCEVGWAGPACDACADGYVGAACDACVDGHFGAACAPCACAHGTCDDGAAGSGACTCEVGFAGATCAVCDTGFVGAACDACDVDFFGPTCLPCDCANGTCDDTIAGDGTCTCDPGWAGAACDDCAVGFVGAACDACADGRYGPTCALCDCVQGTCDDTIAGDGTCTCDPGWGGGACDVCADGFVGEDCDACAPDHYGPSCLPCACGLDVCDAGVDGTGGCTEHTSCASLQGTHPGLPTGEYTIDPDGPGLRAARPAFCDMVTEGGGWTVLFQGDDPTTWRTDLGTLGGDAWSRDDDDVPEGVQEVLLHRVGTGETQVVAGIGSTAVWTCSAGTNGLYWDGSKYTVWSAVHLGVSGSDRLYEGVHNGYVIVAASCHNDYASWGFGHRGWLDDQQGWGWNSPTLGPTTFAIGVR